MPAPRHGRSSFFPLALAMAVGALFWVPAIRAAHGYFPAPLDDVYIHFDFARALGQGRPFTWIAGQGYSSGETSPLYAVVLAIGWCVGFRGVALGVWAALVAVVAVASLIGSTRRLLAPCPPVLATALAAMPLAIGVVDWSLYSGMEIAAFVAVLARALEALDASRSRNRSRTRARRQWVVGAWGAALVWLRPEAVVVVAVLAMLAARGAGLRSGLVAYLRASLPGALATLAVLGTNFLTTGDARSAGARLKLLSSNPYLSDVDRARIFAENLVTFWVKVVRGELSFVPAMWFVLPLLAAFALVRRDRRVVVSACLLSALGWILLVSWNGNAPHHNFRYYVPAIVLVAIAASIGLAGMARARSRGARALATIVALGAFASAVPRIVGQVRHYRTATANIRDQQVAVGERLRLLPAEAKVLLGDAGAIPYVSGRTAIDALGLGGYLGVPFAQAAVHGEAATVELIERLAPADRPTHLALYPNWFAEITSRFGVEIDRVTIDDNVICGGTTKIVYRADWSALGVPTRVPGALQELDVGDVVDEESLLYKAPLPQGGWTTLDVLTDDGGARRFDGGRIIPDRKEESFVVKTNAAGELVLRVRIDHAARGITVTTARQRSAMQLDPAREGHWRSATVVLEGVTLGERITLEANGAYRDYHVWLERRGRR